MEDVDQTIELALLVGVDGVAAQIEVFGGAFGLSRYSSALRRRWTILVCSHIAIWRGRAVLRVLLRGRRRRIWHGGDARAHHGGGRWAWRAR